MRAKPSITTPAASPQAAGPPVEPAPIASAQSPGRPGRPGLAKTHAVSPGSPKLLDRLRQALRARHYSRKTEQAYAHWTKRFIFFHKLRHPTDMGASEVNAFLTHLAVQKHVSASTQNQALSAILFLYRHVLFREIGDLGELVRARRPRRLPVVLTREEVKAVLGRLRGTIWIAGNLLYGAGNSSFPR